MWKAIRRRTGGRRTARRLRPMWKPIAWTLAAVAIGVLAMAVVDEARVAYERESPDDGRAFVGWPWTHSIQLVGVALFPGVCACLVYAMVRLRRSARRQRESIEAGASANRGSG